MAERKINRIRDLMRKWNKSCGYAMALVLLALFCGGCGDGGRQKDGSLIITEKEAEGIQYSMAEAVMGDVILTKRLECIYRQTKEQEVSFSVSGRRVSKTLVQVGDSVKEGQLLAELVSEHTDSRIDELEYQIARNTLLIEHLQTNESNEISRRWLQYLYHSGMTDQEEQDLKESIEKLQQENEYRRQDYQDAVDLGQMELENLRAQDAVSRIYAGMTGTVSWMKTGLEGSISTRDEAVIKIIDTSDCLFVVEGTDHAEVFEEGVPVEMSIGSGPGSGQYILLPYRMGEWDTELFFFLPEEYDSSVIEAGTRGSIEVVLGKSENVLKVPSRAVHMAEDQAYVYVIGEGGIREVRWIETGLYGDDSVEIRDGLKQGEMVIVK